ncbi:MAG: MlaD family protein [Cyanobacteria bacterium]|nr:MlaD family protein [Cyanobacteriota bacterium]
MPKIPTLKVGVLTLVSLFLLIFVLIWLRGRSITGGDSVLVRFNDVDGMREGAAVQFMGIRVGFVDKIVPLQLKGKYYVEVSFSINDKDLKIPKGSKLSIEQSGIIGEKFLEITPPPLQSVTLTMLKDPTNPIMKGIPVKFLYEDGYHVVGQVVNVEPFKEDDLIRYKLSYQITLPGAQLPQDPLYELASDEKHQYFLRILPQEPIVVEAPDRNLAYTIENPLRIKRFLEIQLESAEALKITNDKVNQLLSDETIATLNATLKNTELMTSRATEVLSSANKLFITTSTDLNHLVKASDLLAQNVTEVSKHLNDVIGSPQLKQDILSTVSSIEQSSKALSDIAKDPALRDTLTLTKETSRDASELVKALKHAATDKDLQNRLDQSLTTLNTSLDKLSSVLSDVEGITHDKDQSLNNIVKDTKDTAENLKVFSKKLNGRFLLFRLMF